MQTNRNNEILFVEFCKLGQLLCPGCQKHTSIHENSPAIGLIWASHNILYFPFLSEHRALAIQTVSFIHTKLTSERPGPPMIAPINALYNSISQICPDESHVRPCNPSHAHLDPAEFPGPDCTPYRAVHGHERGYFCAWLVVGLVLYFNAYFFAMV